MVKLRKVLYGTVGVILLYCAYVAISLMSLPSVSDLADRRHSMTIQVKDWKGKPRPFILGPQNRYWTPSVSIPPEMKWAVVLAEDSNFYKHEGIDVKAIKNAIKHDLEKKTFARGASTITQQVAKNLYLSREKSITRKIKEVVIAKRMEQDLTKGRIIELYLNVVELGPMVYGIGHGAQYYFGKPAAALTPRECAFLAAMLPGPRVAYNPYKNLAKVLKRSEMILRLLRGKTVLDENEYRLALAQVPNIGGMQKKVDSSIKKEEAFANTSSAFLQESVAMEKEPPHAEQVAPTEVSPPPAGGVPPGNEDQVKPEAAQTLEQK